MAINFSPGLQKLQWYYKAEIKIHEQISPGFQFLQRLNDSIHKFEAFWQGAAVSLEQKGETFQMENQVGNHCSPSKEIWRREFLMEAFCLCLHLRLSGGQ